MADRVCEPWETWPLWKRLHTRYIQWQQRREEIRQAAMRVNEMRQEASGG